MHRRARSRFCRPSRNVGVLWRPRRTQTWTESRTTQRQRQRRGARQTYTTVTCSLARSLACTLARSPHFFFQRYDRDRRSHFESSLEEKEAKFGLNLHIECRSRRLQRRSARAEAARAVGRNAPEHNRNRESREVNEVTLLPTASA